MRTCSTDGCTRPVYARGLCKRHHSRAERRGILHQYPLAGRGQRIAAFARPKHAAPMPDMPETCQPIIPNPPHYRPWRCPRDADQIVRDGGQITAWPSWQVMAERMAALEARDAARTAVDDVANPTAVEEYAHQAARWRGDC